MRHRSSDLGARALSSNSDVKTLDEAEEIRLRELKSYEVLDTPDESHFDEMVRVAADFFEVPVVLVTLVDRDRQWFKAKRGVEISETPRDIAFCSHAIKSDEVLVVPDATLDLRFAQNPLVTQNPNIRFYAGAPLITSNQNRLGTFCLIDSKPRQLSTAQKEMLVLLSKQVMKELELKKMAQSLREQNDQLELALRRQKEAQAQLIQSSKMTSLGEMAAGIAHEINNPLAVIRARSQMLLMALTKGAVPETTVRDSVQKIEATSLRIAKIVSGLRNFARDGSQDPFVEVSLFEMIDDIKGLCSHRLHAKGIRFEIEIEDESLKVECRNGQIVQVLMNLLTNALDAVLHQPDRWVRLEVWDRGAEVEISVSDCGTGIPVEIQSRMMEPFFTTKDVGQGTGLGLSISKGIVDVHQGSLHYELRNGHTCFVCRLPKRRS